MIQHSRSFRPRWKGSYGKPQHFARRNRGPAIHASKYVNKAIPQEETEAYVSTHTFNDFVVDQKIKDNIIKHGYITPTPIQDQAIEHILAGRDVVGIANTGTGKTAAFLVPLLDKVYKDLNQRVLIVVPTRELAVQIQDEFKAFAPNLGISSLLCMGGSNMGRQIEGLHRRPNFIIGTPGRLKDLVNRRKLHLGDFKTIVLDEVDRMVDIGFIRDIRFLISLLSRERQSLFFSATVSPEINGIIQTFLTNPITISVKKKETAQGIDQDIIRVKDKEEKLVRLHEMLRLDEFNKVLIFGRTKWNVEKLARTLEKSGFSVDSIHGNKSQNQRLNALNKFKQNQLKILVATDIAARGLDIEDVSHVINFDEPATYEDYVHRIGRTGRANKSGKALTFVG